MSKAKKTTETLELKPQAKVLRDPAGLAKLCLKLGQIRSRRIAAHFEAGLK